MSSSSCPSVVHSCEGNAELVISFCQCAEKTVDVLPLVANGLSLAIPNENNPLPISRNYNLALVPGRATNFRDMFSPYAYNKTKKWVILKYTFNHLEDT